MRKSVVIIDDFYDNPDAVRQYALQQQYYYPYQPDEDVRSGKVNFTWKTSWFKEHNNCPFKSSDVLIAALEEATNEEIDLEHWRRSFPITAEGKASPDCANVERSCLWNCCFHLKRDKGQETGGAVHNHVTDVWNGVGENGWAGIIYLAPNAPLTAGLKLWRNKDSSKKFDWMTPKENWEQVDDFGNVYNRMILCRGDLPHSGSKGWDDSLEKGRLFQTFFFHTKQKKQLKDFELL